jgi:hypothetical protein
MTWNAFVKYRLQENSIVSVSSELKDALQVTRKHPDRYEGAVPSTVIKEREASLVELRKMLANEKLIAKQQQAFKGQLKSSGISVVPFSTSSVNNLIVDVEVDHYVVRKFVNHPDTIKPTPETLLLLLQNIVARKDLQDMKYDAPKVVDRYVDEILGFKKGSPDYTTQNTNPQMLAYIVTKILADMKTPSEYIITGKTPTCFADLDDNQFNACLKRLDALLKLENPGLTPQDRVKVLNQVNEFSDQDKENEKNNYNTKGTPPYYGPVLDDKRKTALNAFKERRLKQEPGQDLVAASPPVKTFTSLGTAASSAHLPTPTTNTTSTVVPPPPGLPPLLPRRK